MALYQKVHSIETNNSDQLIKMKKVIEIMIKSTVLVVFILFNNIEHNQLSAQIKPENHYGLNQEKPIIRHATFWDNSGNVEVGFDISFRTAFGFNFGYINPEVKPFNFGYISLFILGADGLNGKGKDYSKTLNKGSYPREVEEEGYSYDHFGIRLGIKTNKILVPYGILGYRRAHFVQNRYDRSKILSNNGKYYISFIDNDKSKFETGIGLKIIPSGYSNRSFNFSIEYSKLKSLSITGNWGFNVK
jgi:hypothetical protein